MRLLRLLAPLLLLAASAVPPSPIVLRETIDPAPPYPQAHASTLAELHDGTLAAAWFGGTGEGYADVRIWFARRGASGWERPVAVADGCIRPRRCQPTWNPVLFQPAGGPLHLFYKVGPDPQHWRGLVRTSTDGGRSWSAARALPLDVLGPIKNKPVVVADGSWLSPSSRETGDYAHGRWTVRIERSTDQGRSWQVGIPIASPTRLDAIQPSILTLEDGRLQLVARTRQGVLAASWSADGGHSWSPLAALALPNPNAGTDAVTLEDGRQLLVYNPSAHWPDRPQDGGPRYPLAVAMSRDGVHWREVLTLEREPIAEGYAYPAVIQTRDGMVHVSYTVGRIRIRHLVLDPRRLL